MGIWGQLGDPMGEPHVVIWDDLDTSPCTSTWRTNEEHWLWGHLIFTRTKVKLQTDKNLNLGEEDLDSFGCTSYFLSNNRFVVCLN